MRKLGPSSKTCTTCGGHISVNPPRPHECKGVVSIGRKRERTPHPELGAWLVEKKTKNRAFVSMVDLLLEKATVGGLPYTFKEVMEEFEAPDPYAWMADQETRDIKRMIEAHKGAKKLTAADSRFEIVDVGGGLSDIRLKKAVKKSKKITAKKKRKP